MKINSNKIDNNTDNKEKSRKIQINHNDEQKKIYIEAHTVSIAAHESNSCIVITIDYRKMCE